MQGASQHAAPFIDAVHPRFSWQLHDNVTTGVYQKAYRIVVTTANGNTVWNSGKVSSASNINVVYAGKALTPSTAYTWTLTVWDNRNRTATVQSAFETTLMSTTDTDKAWSGARWIGGNNANALTFYAHYLPVFRLSVSLSLDEKTRSTRAALLYGGNDRRLMEASQNILGVENARNQSYIKLELNTAGLDKGDSATVCFYRVGYTKTDRPDMPLAVMKVPTDLINKANRYAAHSLEVASMHGTTRVWVDKALQPLGEVNLNPMGKGGDYISFPVVGDMGYDVPTGNRATFHRAEVLNYRLPRATLATLPAQVTLSGEQRWEVLPETGAPMLRTEFSLQGRQVANARIYATARGVYDLYLNGHRVNPDSYLNPGLTQYNKTQFYQTYDVTSLLNSGANALGAVLGEGWWSGALTFAGDNWNFFGDKQSLLLKLAITYTDGSTQTVVSNPASWKFFSQGPWRLGSIFQGEVYDARREAVVNGWTLPRFAETGWTAASEVPLEGTISHERNEGFFSWPCPDDYAHFRLTAQPDEPVRERLRLTAQKVDEVRPGVFVYDMGQNLAGVPAVTFRNLAPGTRVRLRYAEVRYPDLPAYAGHVGMVMMENQRGAMEQDLYTAHGGQELFLPRFTYHGYRYVEITGIPRALPLADVQAVVLSSAAAPTATFESSDSVLNRFFLNTEWSTRANVFSVPTDCPQRNERMGWSGDLSVFSPAMSYLIDGRNFFARHLQALRDTQQPDGAFPPIAPVGGGFGGPLWSSVGIVLPWQSYLQYGDLEAVRVHYPAMKTYTELMLKSYIDPVQHYFKGTGGMADLGDWLGFEVAKNDNSLIFDAYLVYQLHIMEQVAKALGNTTDAQHYATERQHRISFIADHYIDPTTGKTVGTGFGEEKRSPFGMLYGPKRKGVSIDTQTSYALLLALGIVQKEGKYAALYPKVADALVNAVTRESTGDDGKTYPRHSLMTGFIGTAWICDALSAINRPDLAYRMLLNRNYPSWLYPVTQGATTIWERLNSYTLADGFGGNNSMNSFNHYAFGSVTNWLMQHALGIARDEAALGFTHFVLQPTPDSTGQLRFMRGSYHSVQGEIASSWQCDDKGTTYAFTVPANTTATLYLPATEQQRIKVNGKSLTAKGVAHLTHRQKHCAVITLASGSYTFRVE